MVPLGPRISLGERLLQTPRIFHRGVMVAALVMAVVAVAAVLAVVTVAPGVLVHRSKIVDKRLSIVKI